MLIQVFPSGPFETNAYVVACTETKKAAIIDPAPNCADALVFYLEEHSLIAQMILITHSHWDHIGDAAQLKDKYQVPIYVHRLDMPNLKQPGSDGLPLLFHKIEGAAPDSFIAEGDVIELGHLRFEVMHTPGHSPGGICLYIKQHGILFSGDTLFKGSIGNLSFPTANPKEMWNSLAKLAKLPGDTVVYPGHGLPTKIGNEPWLERAQEIFGK